MLFQSRPVNTVEKYHKATINAATVCAGGHDFRPAYRKLGYLRSQLPKSVPMMALTATAAVKVITSDISNSSTAGLRLLQATC